MCIPESAFVVENGSVPSRPVIGTIDIEFAKEKLQEKIRVVENSQVHNIHSKKVVRHRKGVMRKSTKEGLFA